MGRETARILPDGVRETKTYEADQVETRTDFMGRVTTYGYDQNNRLESRTYALSDGTPLPAAAVSFTYTGTGRRWTAVDTRGTTTCGYDVRDRVESMLYPDGRLLSYGWDGSGNRTGLTATIGTAVLPTTSTYDDASRLDLVTDPVGRTHDFGWDANGNRVSLAYPNGTSTAYVYDELNRLRTLNTTGPLGIVQGYTFTLGTAGNRTRIEEADHTVRSYGYDEVYRLTSETVTEGVLTDYSKSFTYDDVGNRLTQTTTGSGPEGSPKAPGSISYSYDERDRLTGEAGTIAGHPVSLTYSHDDNGNVIGKSGEATYTWDVENRLTRVDKTDGTVIENVYDVDGNRVQTTTTKAGQQAQVVNFLVDTSGGLSQVVAETDGTGALKAYYVRGGDDLLSVMRPLVPVPATADDWQTRFFHADGIGSIRRLTKEDGIITDGYTYSAFGELLSHTGSDTQPYAFTGEPLDPNSGFQYHRARWMDPKTDRFASMDSLAGRQVDPATLHRYSYSASDPVDNVDPTGHDFDIGSMLNVMTAVVTIQGMAVLSSAAVGQSAHPTSTKVVGSVAHVVSAPGYPIIGGRTFEMAVGPSNVNWNGTRVSESLTETSNTCPAAVQNMCGNEGGFATFTVGDPEPPLPGKRNTFYDTHAHGFSSDPLPPSSSCRAVCSQEYSCQGNIIGRHRVTYVLARGKRGSTTIDVNKQ